MPFPDDEASSESERVVDNYAFLKIVGLDRLTVIHAGAIGRKFSNNGEPPPRYRKTHTHSMLSMRLLQSALGVFRTGMRVIGRTRAADVYVSMS